MQHEVWVGSKNPVKIEAAKKAFSQVFPENAFVFRGESADSGVPDQPVGIEETLQGAKNRVKYLRQINHEAAYYVGMEGGITQLDNDWFAFAWMFVEAQNGIMGKAITGFFALPNEIVTLLEQDMELGHAIDRVYATENYKQKGGAVGLLTHNQIDRTDYYVHAMVLAMIPFINE